MLRYSLRLGRKPTSILERTITVNLKIAIKNDRVREKRYKKLIIMAILWAKKF